MGIITALGIVAFVALVIMSRLEGDESIGFGGSLEIDDGDADAYEVVPKIEQLGVPNETTGVVESKTLDLDEAVVRKIATIHNGGNFTFKPQLIAETYTRLQTIRKSRAKKNFRIKVPVDTGKLVVTVPGIITEAKIEDLEAEKITVISCTVEVSGKRETADTVEPPA